MCQSFFRIFCGILPPSPCRRQFTSVHHIRSTDSCHWALCFHLPSFFHPPYQIRLLLFTLTTVHSCFVAYMSQMYVFAIFALSSVPPSAAVWCLCWSVYISPPCPKYRQLPSSLVFPSPLSSTHICKFAAAIAGFANSSGVQESIISS